MEALTPHDLLIVRRASYSAILDDPRAPELLDEYSRECSIPQIGKPDPQRDLYELMEKSGLMHSFAFYDDGAMIGFATLLIHVLPHYGKRIANVESLFVSKSHRDHGAGEVVKTEIEDFAKRQGCVGILYNARAGSRLERLLGHLPQYERTNSVFLRTF